LMKIRIPIFTRALISFLSKDRSRRATLRVFSRSLDSLDQAAFPKAVTMNAFALAIPPLSMPITGIAGSCPDAASGHAAAPPSSPTNSRRLMLPRPGWK
jgi:hypothetical protein